MTKNVLVASIPLILFGCDSDGWNDEQEEAYITTCSDGVRDGNSNIPEENIKAFCECALENVKKEHTFDEVTDMKDGENQEFMAPCETELGLNN